MSIRPIMNPRTLLAASLLAGGCVALFTSGCGPSPVNNPSGPIKLKVGYIGLTCEAPIIAAQEKGFYKEEGLDVELVHLGWDSLQSSLSTGKVRCQPYAAHVPAPGRSRTTST